MTSLPCADCFTGTLSTSEPTGTETTLHGLPTYVSLPSQTQEGGAGAGAEVKAKGIIVMIPDAYGWKGRNNRVLCDTYASKGGWVVYLPDFMGVGTPLPESHMSVMAELTTPSSWAHTVFKKPILAAKAISVTIPTIYATRSAIAKPVVTAFFTALRNSQQAISPPAPQTTTSEPSPPEPTSPTPQPLKIGVAAFCWGGQHAVSLSHASLIDCAFTAHPSFIKIPSDFVDLKVPLSVCVGDDDKMSAGPKGVLVMKELLDGMGVERAQCVILKGARHGFAVRSCVLDEVQNGYAVTAEKQALDWFERWLL